MTALLSVIVGIILFASGFFAGAVCMANAMRETHLLTKIERDDS